MTWLLPRPPMRVPAEKDGVVQVKYTNPDTVLHGSVSCVAREGRTLSGPKRARRETKYDFCSRTEAPL